ncbi:MAG: secretin N-terminal domain-containing protein [Candidatus Eisenbacteria bacterium]|nr:secretin N-terminal domain-containing protein [Candidatus Eisenbacteria bacterium]
MKRDPVSRVSLPSILLLLPLFLFAIGAVAPVRAQEAPRPVPETTLITLDADQIALTEILQILANRAGLNIVTSPGVQDRRISLHLKNTPFYEALNLVVRAAGLGYERVGNSILVADVQTLSTETGFVTRVFDLQYASAQDAQKFLNVISQDVEANVSGEQLIVRGSPSTIEQVAQAIQQLDRKPAQILLEARLIEVNASRLWEMGIDWEKVMKFSTIFTEGAVGSSAPGDLPDELDYVPADQTADIYRQLAYAQVDLDLLLTDGAARLLSNSKIVTLNNTSAEIFSGETVPVIVSSLASPAGGGGVLQTVQVEKIDVGVKLVVTPRISSDGLITVLVEPEVSRIIAFVGPASDLPQTSTRRARSLVRVHDGEKIFLGGLLSDETRKTVKKVPILGQIPILGALFQHYRDDHTRLDLLIEITPHIVGDTGSALPDSTHFGPQEIK